jgi:hypothetical protein
MKSVHTSQETHYVSGTRSQSLYSFRVFLTYKIFPLSNVTNRAAHFYQQKRQISFMLSERLKILYVWDVIIGYLKKFVASASSWNFLGGGSTMKEY